MSHDLTRWIEDADTRRFHQAALFDRSLAIGENHYVHLGDAVANLSSWLRHHANRDALAAIGCQVHTPRAEH
ncbi:MAG TPA: hypothetical protein VG651_13145 [Stellaceae bacterium]|nr:hypothetical protein [Stellaceae bacterium]